MSAEHEAEVHDVMRQVLDEMKEIKSRLERIETRQKQIEGDSATLVADENLQKMIMPHTAVKLQAQLFARDHPAAEAFFSTPELLETMLLELPMQDLLLAQRVCLRFKGTIDGSIKIRRALFFEPEPVAKEGGAVASRVNPLLTEESQLHRHRFIITEPTPMCRFGGPKLPISMMVKITDESVGVERKHIDCFLEGATYFSNGSWRKMLVAQSVKVFLLVSLCGPLVWFPRQVHPAPTMEEVCDLTHKFGHESQ